MRTNVPFAWFSLSIISITIATAARAQDAPAGEDLAKKLANPVASLISVPFQNNLDFGIGSEDATRYQLNVQPVWPFALNDDWNLITRTIVPFISQGAAAPGLESKTGLGDIIQSFFLSPASSDPIWGVGPVLLYPTATDKTLGTEKWGIGPTFVVLKQEGPWTYGALANHIWSFAGKDTRRDLSLSFVQPFVAYVTPTGFTYTLNTETTYDWKGNQWTIPVNAVATKLVKIAGQPASIGLGLRLYLEAPSGGPDWGIRVPITLMFPK
jgi:hypothetical protein